MKIDLDLTRLGGYLQQMGAVPVTYSSDWKNAPIDPIDIQLPEGLEISLEELEPRHGLLSHKGRQVLLYIPDQGWDVREALTDGSKGRRFHVAECRTLHEMRSRGRFERYVVTNRLDGEFKISGTDQEVKEPVEGFTRLWVCQNCLNHLNYKNARYERSAKRIAGSFKIDEFFATYASFFTHLPRRHAAHGVSDGYTPDWPERSREARQRQGYRCQTCRVMLEAHPHLLQVHHVNGVKSDNSPTNLKVLCVACHRNEPHHSHLFVKKEDRRTIDRARREQGLVPGANWAAVAELCDPAVRGLLDACRAEGAPVPEPGQDIEVAGRVVACLELAWPDRQIGVAIVDEDYRKATAAGWKVYRVDEALDRDTGLVADIRSW